MSEQRRPRRNKEETETSSQPVNGRGNGTAPPPVAPEAADLREYLGLIRRQWLLIVVGALLGGAAAAYQVLTNDEVPRYSSTAVIQFENTQQALAGNLGTSPMRNYASDRILSELQVLKSQRVVGSVVDSLGLRLRAPTEEFRRSWLSNVTVDATAEGGTLQLRFGQDSYTLLRGDDRMEVPYGSPVDLAGVSFAVTNPPPADSATLVVESRRGVIGRVTNGLSAQRRTGTDVVDVRYVGSDPLLVPDVTNALVHIFKTESALASKEESRRRRIFLEEQLAATDSMVVGAQEDLIRFRSEGQVYSSSERLAAEQSGLMGLEVRQEELAADRRMYASLLESLTQALDADRQRELQTLVSAPGVASNPVVSRLYGQLVSYELALDTMTTGDWGSAATNPDVQRLRRLMNSTRERLVEAVSSHIGAVDARLAALEDLRQRRGEQLSALPEAEAQEARLLQQLETAREMAELVRGEFQRARVSEAVEGGEVEIVDLAEAPAVPVPTGGSTTRTVLFGILLGLMTGGATGVFRERLNNTIRQKDDVEHVLGLTPLVVVPQSDLSGNGSRAARLRLTRKANDRKAANGHAAASGARVVSQELVAVHDARSAGAEAYRTLRTNLLYSDVGGDLKTLVVTSAAPGEGKTTVASNLATTFAQQGISVLLVDTDLRKARLHGVFGLDRKPGLSELMLGETEPKDAVQKTDVKGLYILASGALPPNPAEMLGSQKMRRLVEKLREGFELVIFDTPPLLAAGDAAVLGAGMDGVVLVVRAGETDRGAVLEAIGQLDHVGARIVGAVLNDPNATVPLYGGYYYYEYYGDAT